MTTSSCSYAKLFHSKSALNKIFLIETSCSISQAFKELAHRFRFEMHQTVANRPRGSGLVERSNQSILQRWGTHGIFLSNEWDVDSLFTEIQFNNLTSNSL